jgi:hypothetical protein
VFRVLAYSSSRLMDGRGEGGNLTNRIRDIL